MKTVSINEAAAIKGVSRQAIHAAIKAGRLSAVTVKVPHQRVTRASLDKFQPNPNMKRAGRKASNDGKKPVRKAKS